MGTVNQILTRKGSQVMSISPNASVLDAALLMNEHKIGALIVLDKGQVSGIFTERDVLRRVVAKRLDSADVIVRDAMTREVICCRPDTSMDEARNVFMKRRIRHLPVVEEDGQLKGMISIGDLNAWDRDGQQRTIHYLHEYLYGNI
jgi:CBS domain-containing protein